jgi:hypothetical protein
MLYVHVMFDRFVENEGVRLRAGLVAAYGPEVGLDAASEASRSSLQNRPFDPIE